MDIIVKRNNTLQKICMTVLLMVIGMVAVYVLWTPREGNLVKRPTWQFVLLIISVFLPLTINGIASAVSMRSAAGVLGFFHGLTISRMLSLLGWRIYIACQPMRWTALIMLLVKCERQAKKIIIVYMVMYGLSLIETIAKQAVSMQDIDMYMQRMATIGIISSVISIVCLLLIGWFTLWYTKNKIKEAQMKAA